MAKGKKLRYDPRATSGDPKNHGSMTPPVAPVYSAFPLVLETETDGWIYGAITEFETAEPQFEGDGFVVAPDGSRAGIAWATDTPDFYEILPPDQERWGVYGVRFPRPVASVADLVANFRAVLPDLKERHAQLQRSRT